MAIPEGVEAPKEEPVGGSVPELKVVPDTEGIKKEEGEPLEGSVKEYNPEIPPSEERMAEMEAAKQDNAEQKPFNNYAKEADADKEEKISWLRKLLGGGGK